MNLFDRTRHVSETLARGLKLNPPVTIKPQGDQRIVLSGLRPTAHPLSPTKAHFVLDCAGVEKYLMEGMSHGFSIKGAAGRGWTVSTKGYTSSARTKVDALIELAERENRGI